MTYEIFAAYWPHAIPYEEGDALDPAGGKEDPRIIAALNDFPKYVFSTTLPEQDWQHTHLLRGGLEDEVRRLRDDARQNVNIQGSASIVRALQQADLIDEYHLYVHPVLLGDGQAAVAARPLFDNSFARSSKGSTSPGRPRPRRSRGCSRSTRRWRSSWGSTPRRCARTSPSSPATRRPRAPSRRPTPATSSAATRRGWATGARCCWAS